MQGRKVPKEPCKFGTIPLASFGKKLIRISYRCARIAAGLIMSLSYRF